MLLASRKQFNNPFRTQKELTLFPVYNNNLAIVSGMAKEKPKEASVSPYQFSPQTSINESSLTFTGTLNKS